ncbi:MAG: tRNA guanosine(34) transglycosylase Tgt [bacterium]|nr:tRNA guanosine(34) transglycosylase Tgt [bacterium]
MFSILRKDSQSRARLGILKTEHGDVQTPAYVIVGTYGSVRCLEPEDLVSTKTQLIIANTYHLWRGMSDDELNNYPGLHEVMEWKGPLMTDSGGFQVFSLGASREHGTGKVKKYRLDERGTREGLVRVTDAGVYFKDGKEEAYLDAELSMRIQEQLGADIIFAFDEPSSPHHDYAYTKIAMDRTHRWAERSLDAKASRQLLYGIVQGGAFEDLRKESATFIGKLPFDGYAIGGSFGSSFGSTHEETAKELEWTIPFLPEQKPRHLLGIGRIHDVFEAVHAGIDTFDCVIPTREARHGALWTAQGRIDITKGKYAADRTPVDSNCDCPMCTVETDRSALHALFKAKDLEAGRPRRASPEAGRPRRASPEAGRVATIHNVSFFNALLEKIRGAIAEGRFLEFKKEYLREFSAGGKGTC